MWSIYFLEKIGWKNYALRLLLKLSLNYYSFFLIKSKTGNHSFMIVACIRKNKAKFQSGDTQPKT